MVAWPSTSAVRENLSDFYDAETRPKIVADGLAWAITKLGAENVVSEKTIEAVASLSTVSGFLEQKDVFKEIASSYIEKAKQPEGRKELVAAAREIASEKLIKPTRELASEKVLKSASEMAAPYIAKLESKRSEIVASKRFEKAMEAVAAMEKVVEKPIEKVSELRAKAIDLLKYDNLASYRNYVQSEEFQADTMRLVKVDLPAFASHAAYRGVDSVKHAAMNLASEIEQKRGDVILCLERGFSAARKIELQDLRARAKVLVAEMQTEVMSGVSHARAEGFSVSDTIARMKRMIDIVETVLSPVLNPLGAAKNPDVETEPPTEVEQEVIDVQTGAENVANVKMQAEDEDAVAECVGNVKMQAEDEDA